MPPQEIHPIEDVAFWTRYMPFVPRVLLVAANVIPLIGVLMWDWDVVGLLILYWSENLVLGFYTIVKMIHKSPVGGVLLSLFFMFHFGAFCGVHGFFLLSFTEQEMISPGGQDAWPFIFIFAQMLRDVIQHILTIAPREWMLGFAAIVVSHGVSLVYNYFGKREYEHETINSLMHAPYRRIIVLHIAIIAGGFAVLALGSPLPLLLILVLLKTGIDLHFHTREHRLKEAG